MDRFPDTIASRSVYEWANGLVAVPENRPHGTFFARLVPLVHKSLIDEFRMAVKKGDGTFFIVVGSYRVSVCVWANSDGKAFSLARPWAVAQKKGGTRFAHLRHACGCGVRAHPSIEPIARAGRGVCVTALLVKVSQRAWTTQLNVTGRFRDVEIFIVFKRSIPCHTVAGADQHPGLVADHQ